jgi:integrase
MFERMVRTGKPFWAWSYEEWAETITFAYGKSKKTGEALTIRVAAYLLCGLLITGNQFSPSQMALIIFGNELVVEEYEHLALIIFGNDGFGYWRSQRQDNRLRAALALARLVNRNPYLEALTIESLQATKPLLTRDYQDSLHKIVRVLMHLHILKENAFATLFEHSESAAWWEYTASDVDPKWIAWLQAYVLHLDRFSDTYRKVQFYYLIIAGRWLKKYHPTIVAPSGWSESLAQDYVTWLCHAERGELVSVDAHTSEQTSRVHTPLQPGSIDTRIRTIKRFFKALQKRPYQVSGNSAQRLALSWDPDEVFVLPENLRRRIAPNPRNIDPSWWQKLTWAAATLSAKDLSAYQTAQFPLAYYRAVGLLWVTGARRADEIRRLKVGCISREWAPEMRDEDGNQGEPEEDLAYLRVPVNKYQGEFWSPIPSYAADAIEVWERLRPRLQQPRIDRKEQKLTDYLFMMRNRLMGKTFLNEAVIPLLCKVAGLVDEQGIPLRDAVGKITSHRARSTLATWLRSNGLSLTYIAKLLGHTDLKTLPWYLREDRHMFARMVRKHNPLDRMVTAILDTEALKRGEGEPAVFYYLGYGPDGRPHLCASPDYQTCIHQMRCTECEMHVDAEQAEVIACRPGVLTIEVHISTPPLVAELLDQEEELGTEVMRHLPAPEVPSPAYHFNKNVPPRSSDPELQQMKQELEALSTEWAEKAGKFDLRSIGMKSLKKRIADLAAKIEKRETKRIESP